MYLKSIANSVDLLCIFYDVKWLIGFPTYTIKRKILAIIIKCILLTPYQSYKLISADFALFRKLNIVWCIVLQWFIKLSDEILVCILFILYSDVLRPKSIERKLNSYNMKNQLIFDPILMMSNISVGL